MKPSHTSIEPLIEKERARLAEIDAGMASTVPVKAAGDEEDFSEEQALRNADRLACHGRPHLDVSGWAADAWEKGYLSADIIAFPAGVYFRLFGDVDGKAHEINAMLDLGYARQLHRALGAVIAVAQTFYAAELDEAATDGGMA